MINCLELLFEMHFSPYCQLFPSAICKDWLLIEGHANSGQENRLSWQIMDIIATVYRVFKVLCMEQYQISP